MDVYKEWLGISEEFRPPTHYQLLRLVDFEDNVDQVRGNYKKLNAHVRKYASGDYLTQSQELLNELAKAMLCLTDSERKREYDEGLGREFNEEETEGSRPLLKILSSQGDIERQQISEIEDFAERRGLSHRDAVVQMKLVTAEKAAQALAEELGRPFVDLEVMTPDDDVLDQVPRNVVKRHAILPLFVDDDVVLIASVDEPDHELEEEMRFRFGIPMRSVIAAPLQIKQGIAKFYAPGVRDESVAPQSSSKKSSGSKSSKSAKPKQKLSEAEKHQQKQLNYIFAMWAFIGSILIDQYLIRPFLFPTWPYLIGLSLIVTPGAAYFAWMNYNQK